MTPFYIILYLERIGKGNKKHEKIIFISIFQRCSQYIRKL